MGRSSEEYHNLSTLSLKYDEKLNIIPKYLEKYQKLLDSVGGGDILWAIILEKLNYYVKVRKQFQMSGRTSFWTTSKDRALILKGG